MADPGALAILPANLMVYLHDTCSVSWLVALPISALVIRSTLVYPMFQLQRRRNQSRLAMLQPLVDAEISRSMSEKVSKAASASSARTLLGSAQHKREIRKVKQSTQSKQESRFKLPTYRWSSKIVPVLILLTVSEAVRRLCGSNNGLLTVLCGPFQPYIAWVATPMTGIAESLYGLLPSSARAQSDALDTSSYKVDASLEATSQEFHTSGWAQESMKTGGFSFCQDLTAPDPTKILPVVFSSTFFATIWFSPGQSRPANFYQADSASPGTGEPAPKKRTFWQKVLLGVSAISIVPAMSMPCALLCYFIANMAVTRLQTAWLVRRFPIVAPPLASGQPMTFLSRTSRSRQAGTVAEGIAGTKSAGRQSGSSSAGKGAIKLPSRRTKS